MMRLKQKYWHRIFMGCLLVILLISGGMVFWAGSIHIPTLIAHGTADDVVSMAAGRRLFDALPESTPKRWVEIPTAGHDNVLVTEYPIYADIAEWMLRNVAGR